jgi:hypothetical protein
MDETDIIQSHILSLIDIGFIDLTDRQKKLLDAYAKKYQKKGLPQQVYNELINDATKLIIFA